MRRPTPDIPDYAAEEAARERGFRCIGGIDEAGRGPLAGPVVAACVVLPPGGAGANVRDSKSLSPRARDDAYASIVDSGAAIGVGQATAAEIDAQNILRATHAAMRRAVASCPLAPDFLLIDGLPVPFLPAPHRAIVQGDRTCASIAAASIVAKVTRDRAMDEIGRAYPVYGFERHKGYPTPDHLALLRSHGPCAEHRRSFAPVRAILLQPTLALDLPPHRGVGTLGEEAARYYLESIGYRILSTRFRAAQAEIDIVAMDGPTLVFVEVKSSADAAPSGRLAARLGGPQQRRLRHAAQVFVAQHGYDSHACRFDVIEIADCLSAEPAIRHYAAVDLDERP